jgi:hypothetical protein
MFFRRSLLGPLLGPVSREKVNLLFGARQTGKTELLRQVLRRSEPAQLFDLQDSALRRQLETDPSRFGREVRALPKQTKVVVVDEIQKVPALLEEVQALYDAAPTRWRFFLTGSSARRLRAGAANLLPGRSHLYRIHPVTRWEEGADDLEIGEPSQSVPAGQRLPPPFAEQTLTRRLLFGSLRLQPRHWTPTSPPTSKRRSVVKRWCATSASSRSSSGWLRSSPAR